MAPKAGALGVSRILVSALAETQKVQPQAQRGQSEGGPSLCNLLCGCTTAWAGRLAASFSPACCAFWLQHGLYTPETLEAEGPDIAGCSEPGRGRESSATSFGSLCHSSGADACIKGHGQNLVESSEAYEKRRRLRARGCGGHGSGGSGSSPGRPGRPGCPGPAGAQADACHGGHGGHGHGDLGERREALEGADVGCLLC